MSDKLFIRKPVIRNGMWCVIIADSASPLANEIEVIQCGSHERAYQSYLKIKGEINEMGAGGEWDEI